ncbi:MAG TPA: DedA family protein [SAR86 cluster bacterium]|mgnify:FL=1|nr:DedA family protein [SAR86 cluster bacterium]HJM14979.1 DedA family protein [SAR86 cluster bacterium]HJM59844.1 DedA family protein [SAR86 cluster bacterium]
MFEFNEVILWLKDNPEWIALGVFGAAFIESFALIGVIIPGVVLLAVISGMAASTLSVFELVLIAYVASFLADILSFLFGTGVSKSIDKLWPFNKYPNLLVQGRSFVRRFGILGVFVGKFIGPIRPLLPLTAGSLGMNFKYFLTVEIFSSFLWALLYTVPGYYAGKSILDSQFNLNWLIAIIIGVVVLIVIVRYFNRKYIEE